MSDRLIIRHYAHKIFKFTNIENIYNLSRNILCVESVLNDTFCEETLSWTDCVECDVFWLCFRRRIAHACSGVMGQLLITTCDISSLFHFTNSSHTPREHKPNTKYHKNRLTTDLYYKSIYQRVEECVTDKERMTKKNLIKR